MQRQCGCRGDRRARGTIRSRRDGHGRRMEAPAAFTHARQFDCIWRCRGVGGGSEEDGARRVEGERVVGGRVVGGNEEKRDEGGQGTESGVCGVWRWWFGLGGLRRGVCVLG